MPSCKIITILANSITRNQTFDKDCGTTFKFDMKKNILVGLFLFIAATMSAQESLAFEKGYRGSVGLGGNVSVTKGVISNSVELSTSHGYSFGDGMYIGGGIGLDLELDGGYAGVPVFFDMKYNIVDWKLSPYVDCRAGAEIILSEGGRNAFIISPGIGFDYRRLNLRVGYKCMAGSVYELHTMSLSVGINF